MPTPRPVLSSAKRIALCTLASRITGLLRDILLARTFALSWVQDAFSYAFALPNLFRRLFGEGGLAPVFIPTFTQTLERDGPDAAWRLLARTFALLTVALVAVTLLIEGVVLAAWLLAPPMTPEQLAERSLLLGLTALMMPFMISICLLALFAAILNVVGSFVPGALAPVVLNICMIAALAGVGVALGGTPPEQQVWWVALSVLIAGVLQLLTLRPALRAHGVRVAWQLDTADPTVRRMLRLLPPVALGQGVLAFGVFLDAQICILLTRTAGAPPTIGWLGGVAYPLSEGALSALTYAQRLYQFPLGVLVISLATAALPAFSRLAAQRDWAAWTNEVRALTRMALFESVLAGAMMIALAEPIVRLLFEYGEFDAADTTRTAGVLAWYGVGLWAFSAQHIVLRGFYSLHDAATPLRISCAVLPLNLALSVVLVWLPAIRESAFAISSAATYGVAVIVGVLVLQRRQGATTVDRSARIINGEFAIAVAKMLLAAAAAGAVVAMLTPVWHAVESVSALPEILRRGLATASGLGTGAAVYVLVAALLRLPEAGALLARARRRLRGPRRDSR
ncbi:MAG: murein biosynthesis integral membrane protein MurJ [Phycisphaerae bacterium]